MTAPAARPDPAVPDAAPREPSEFACYEPLLRRLAALPAEDPERAVLRDELIVAFLPLGERIAARYAAAWPGSREDLRQVASLGVINAVDRWDPDRARGDVLGFIVPSVRGEVLRYLRDRTWAVRVPRRLKELTVAINRATAQLTHQLGRAPRPSELARHLDTDVEEIVDALHAEANHHAAPLDAPGPRGDGPGERSLADQLSEPDRDMEAVDDVVTLGPLLKQLPERERRIVELRFFQDCTQSQIAQEIGISQMHVSRLLTRILGRLRNAMLDEPATRPAARCSTHPIGYRSTMVEPGVLRDDSWNTAQRAESGMQRADRNFAELLQELRILLTSVQILFGFLLTAAVTGAAGRLDDIQHAIYVTAIVAAAISSMLLVAPVAIHRLLFRRGRKVEVVMAAQRAAVAGTAGLGVVSCAGFVLVLDLAVGRFLAVALGAALLIGTVLVWFVVPVRLRRP